MLLVAVPWQRTELELELWAFAELVHKLAAAPAVAVVHTSVFVAELLE